MSDAAFVPPAPPRTRANRRGYTMVALLIGIAIMTVMIGALLPLASAESQRDKEEELIFRGTQYAEGIRLFRRRYGRYPNTLKEMFDLRPRTIRKLWKDPITNSDDWGIVSPTTGAPLPGQQGGGTTTPPGSPGSMMPTPTPAPTPSPTPSSGFGATPAGADPAGPVAGVYSKSKKKGYRIYQGREAYNEWRFTEQTLMQQTGGPTVPGPGVPK